MFFLVKNRKAFSTTKKKKKKKKKNHFMNKTIGIA